MRVIVDASKREIKTMKSIFRNKLRRGTMSIVPAVPEDKMPDVDDDSKDDEKAASETDTKETGIADDKICCPPDTKSVSPSRKDADKPK
ncbi:MAG: hypothetical protein K2M69_02040 [Muribaculaceae bacterium]|nr:hypothetical protein [Muribaculaceae bacterium]